MWRAFFMAIGICLALGGFESLVVERAVLASKPTGKEKESLFGQTLLVKPKREVTPPDWMPWSLLSSGAVTMLYSTTLRAGGGEKK